MINIFFIKNLILDILFPIYCLGCGVEFEHLPSQERWICIQCLEEIKIRNQQVCPVCEQLSEGGNTHFRCQEKTSLDGLWVSSEYSDDVVSTAIHKLKFNFVREISFPLSRIVIKSILNVIEFSDFHELILAEFSQDSEEEKIYIDENKNKKNETILIPVPLYKKRYNWRGFNQSFLLARYIADEFHLKLSEKVLIRKRNTKPQTKIKSMTKRKENMKNAFFIFDVKNVKDKNIILIDDVCTTSATLDECAKELKKAGAKNVWGLVIARR